MVTGKEVHTQKIDFLRLFGKKVVSDVSRWAWHRRNRVINREKPIVLKLALIFGIAAVFIDCREWLPAVAGAIFAVAMLSLEAVFWLLVAQG